MAWWGKIIGGTFGFMLGGPLGAMLGAALGHNFDRGLKITDEFGGFAYGDQERVQAAFFTATFSIMGHVAKADGKVSQAEIANAEAIMSRMQLDPQQRQAAIKLFDEGKAEDFPLDEVLVQFRKECHRRVNLMQMFLEVQISTAFSDQKLHPAEKEILYRIADVLGFSREQLDHLFHLAGVLAALEKQLDQMVETPTPNEYIEHLQREYVALRTDANVVASAILEGVPQPMRRWITR